MPTTYQSVQMDSPLSQNDAQASPYSPTLINLNSKYNMSASSLTEALLLLSGMFISLVQPEPGPIKIGLHAVFPRTTASFRSAITDPFSERNKLRTFSNFRSVLSVFDISTSYTRSEYAPKELLDMLCTEVFPKNTITIFYVNNHIGLQQYSPPAVRYLPRLLESLGLPIISYDTQFSPNAKPALSVQLAPTMAQMMDVIFSFLKRFNWTDFSFLCTLSYGCVDEITSIRSKVDEFHLKSHFSIYGVETYQYKLLSYVNFTDGRNRKEVQEKLKYELHKDSRINLVHGNGAEVKTIMDIAKELGLTGEEYVWIFTAASISISNENSIVDDSYPLGSFIIGFDSSRDDMENVVKAGVNIWLQALNSLISSQDFDNIDFKTGFSCDRIKDEISQKTNQTGKSPLFWKHGELLYKYILNSSLPGGLMFDDSGILKTNKFWILNVQHEDPSNYPEDYFEKKFSGHNFMSSAPGLSGQHKFGSSILIPEPRGTEIKLPKEKKNDGEGHILSLPWDSLPMFPVLRNGTLNSNFPGNVHKNVASVLTLERRSRSSRDLQFPTGRDILFSKSLKNVKRPVERSNTFNKPGNESILPAFKKRKRIKSMPHFEKLQSTQTIFQGVHSKTSKIKHPAKTFIQTTYTGYQIHKDKRTLAKEVTPAPDVTSSTIDYKTKNINYFNDYGKHKTSPEDSTFPYNTYSRNNNSAFKSILNTSNKNFDTTKAFPALLSDRNVRKGKGLLHSSNQSKLKHPGNKQGHTSHNHQSCRNHKKQGNCKKNHTLEKKHNKKLLHFQNRSLSHRNGNVSDRSRRQVKLHFLRKQISKKVADWDGNKLSVTGITWPGGNSQPPKGKPEKYVLRVVTWKEDPHVTYLEKESNVTDGSASCGPDSLPCQVYIRNKNLERSNRTKEMCCTGLSIDLLKKLGEMLHFDVQLMEVPDGGYGSPLNKNFTNWNGMLGMLIHNEADMAIGALSITPERSVAVDFSVPFLQTGIAIIVAIREGVISPTAFLGNE